MDSNGPPIRVDPDRIEVVDGTITVEWAPTIVQRFSDGSALARLAPGSGGHDDPDLSIGSPNRNLVRVTPAGEVAWIVDAAAGLGPTDSHCHVTPFEDLLLTETCDSVHGEIERGSDRTAFCLVAAADGSVQAAWPRDEFVIGTHRHEYDGPVRDYLLRADTVFVTTDHALYAYEPTGTPRWRRPVPTALSIRERTRGLVYEGKWRDRPPRSIRFDVDPETGAFEHVRGRDTESLRRTFLDAEVELLQ